MKSGFITLLLLYIINNSKEPIYGYKIIKELNAATSEKLKFREGTVYPILRYLQDQDFAAVAGVQLGDQYADRAGEYPGEYH